jgi:hypothetical protein
MVLILGFSLEVVGKDTDSEKQDLKQMCVPLGILVLEPDASVEQKKSAVEFDHSKHFVYDCKACHHKWDIKKEITNCTTSECHDLLKSPKKPTKYLSYTETGIKYYKYAFHRRCVGCHKEIRDKRKKMEMSYQVLESKLPNTGPTGCIECHPKE